MYLCVTKDVFPLNKTFLLCRVTVASSIYKFPALLLLQDQVCCFHSGFLLFTPSAECFPPGPSLPDITPWIGSGCALCPWVTWASHARDSVSSKGPAARRRAWEVKERFITFSVRATLGCFSLYPILVKERFLCQRGEGSTSTLVPSLTTTKTFSSTPEKANA